MRLSTFALSGLIGLFALALVPAQADTLTYNFTSDHCTNPTTGAAGGCSTGAANMGTITLTDGATGVVDVHVVLQSGFGFVSTGAGAGASFFFRLLGDPTITYSNLTTGWSIPNALTGDQQAAKLPPNGYAGDGLGGQFNYALSCNPPGTSGGGCGNGGSSPKAPPLNFTITATGLSTASFNDPITSGQGAGTGTVFAADVISTNGNTGLIDASLCTDCTPRSTEGGEVPEPTSIVLLGSTIVGVVSILRKKAQQKA